MEVGRRRRAFLRERWNAAAKQATSASDKEQPCRPFGYLLPHPSSFPPLNLNQKKTGGARHGGGRCALPVVLAAPARRV